MNSKDARGILITSTHAVSAELARPRERSRTAGRDLATNLPGSAARARAIELRRSAPVLTALARAFDLRTPERNWRIGADGEKAVGNCLRRLPEGWHVLHAIPVGRHGADIDHLVVCPAGVFSLNTKNHARSAVRVYGDSVYVGDFSTDYVRKARLEARRASRYLSVACGFEVDVHPVLVVLASGLVVKRRPVGVDVVDHRYIYRWLKHHARVLPPTRVSEVFARARREVTWR